MMTSRTKVRPTAFDGTFGLQTKNTQCTGRHSTKPKLLVIGSRDGRFGFLYRTEENTSAETFKSRSGNPESSSFSAMRPSPIQSINEVHDILSRLAWAVSAYGMTELCLRTHRELLFQRKSRTQRLCIRPCNCGQLTASLCSEARLSAVFRANHHSSGSRNSGSFRGTNVLGLAGGGIRSRLA